MSDQPSRTGLITSGALHGALLVALIVGFATTPKFDDATESIPVATVSQSQFNEIMKGDRNGTPTKAPTPEPPQRVAATPPPPPSPPVPPTPPTPPPDLKTAEQTPSPPAPPPPPRPETPKAAPPAASPPPKPLAEDAPLPPTPPAPPSPRSPPTRMALADAPSPPVRPRTPPPVKFRPDQLAKLLERSKPQESKPDKAYDPNAIAKLIGETKSSSQSARALGLADRHDARNAPRMSPSLSAGLDAWLTDAYLNCWTPPPTMPEGEHYVAEVRVAFNPDGTLASQPTLLNPPTDPAWRPHAESAVRAVLKCNPLHVPPQYQPYFEQWRTKTVHFDPQNALG